MLYAKTFDPDLYPYVGYFEKFLREIGKIFLVFGSWGKASKVPAQRQENDEPTKRWVQKSSQKVLPF